MERTELKRQFGRIARVGLATLGLAALTSACKADSKAPTADQPGVQSNQLLITLTIETECVDGYGDDKFFTLPHMQVKTVYQVYKPISQLTQNDHIQLAQYGITFAGREIGSSDYFVGAATSPRAVYFNPGFPGGIGKFERGTDGQLVDKHLWFRNGGIYEIAVFDAPDNTLNVSLYRKIVSGQFQVDCPDIPPAPVALRGEKP